MGAVDSKIAFHYKVLNTVQTGFHKGGVTRGGGLREWLQGELCICQCISVIESTKFYFLQCFRVKKVTLVTYLLAFYVMQQIGEKFSVIRHDGKIQHDM